MDILSKKNITLKIITLASLFFVLIPGDKFSLFYGFRNLVMLITSLVSISFLTMEFLVGISYLIGTILAFRQKNKIFLLGYLLLTLGVCVEFYTNGMYNSLLFWIPLIIFVIGMLNDIYLSIKRNS